MPIPGDRIAAQSQSLFDEADVAQRATLLLKAFFTDHPDLQRTALDLAFTGHKKDPRSLIDSTGTPAAFAVECVSELLAYGCTDGRRHSLARLLAVIRDELLGANPHPDYVELPLLLDGPCLLPSREEERAYLEALLADIERKAALYAPLRGIAQIAPNRAEDPMLSAWDDLALLRHVRRADTRQQAKSRDFDDILSAFSRVKRAALLGRPGAGKTTTLRKLAADLADRSLAEPAAPLPVLVSLGDWTGSESFQTFLTDRLPGIGDAILPLSRSGRLILLLDGLNELPTAKRTAKVGEIRKQISALDQETPVFVSCRADDYQDDLNLGLDTLSLQPLSPQRVRGVLRQWLQLSDPQHGEVRAERLFWHLAGDEALAAVLETWRKAGADEDLFWTTEDIPRENPDVYGQTTAEEDDLWYRHVRDLRSLLRLAANPFMLTMLFWVWIDRGETLPRNRGDLFARFVDALLDREHLLLPDNPQGVTRYSPDGENLLSGLTDIAWIMQGERLGQVDQKELDLGVLTVVARKIAVRELGSEALLKKAEDATLPEGGDQIRFRHQLLQEYFTASAMRWHIEDTPPMRATELWTAERWWARSGSEESAVLLAGLYSDDCTPVLRWLRDAQPEVAAQCVLDSGAEIADRDALFRELHDAWLPRLTDIAREPEARAAVGRAMGRLGLDDRKGVGLDTNGLPDIDWVEIPGGEFVYQDGERRRIDTFWIARYPVTNAQFRAFLDAEDGYADDRWWKGLEDPNRNPERPRWDIPNHPREAVSWFEVMAFCAWLGHRLRHDIRLPTEWQWERAARGTDGRVYPWGDDYQPGRANIDETWDEAGPHNLGRTSAVGIYPHGASPERVLDLSGNVWEWCLNEYANPERTQPGGSGSRVLRGGSWYYYQDLARADPRFFDHPNFRLAYYGFRVVCASPIR